MRRILTLNARRDTVRPHKRRAWGPRSHALVAARALRHAGMTINLKIDVKGPALKMHFQNQFVRRDLVVKMYFLA
jgi:hypothetical protein